jgi:hypothetical protein
MSQQRQATDDGRMSIKRVVLISLLTAFLACGALAPAVATPTGTAARGALVLYATWDSGNGTHAAPADKSLGEVTGAVGLTARNWFRSVSHGQFPGWNARGMGPVPITPPRMDADGECGGQFQGDVQSRLDAKARASSIDPSKYDVVVYYFSKIRNCDWNGMAGPRLVWLNGTTGVGTVAQELGHTLDLGHGLALVCRDVKGRVVTLSNKCEIVPYGDPFNASGKGIGSFSGIQQDDLGWMTGRIANAGLYGGTFTLAPLESDAVATQVLKVPDGDGTLWLEYRRRVGVDAAAMSAGQEGVQVRREIPNPHGRKSILLDMAPDGADFWDARLPVGASFKSPFSSYTIKVVSATDTGAIVEVTVPTKTVPNVVNQNRTTATQTLQGAGFQVRSYDQVDDATCDHVGLVIRQSPGGGTTAREGAIVSIYVGKPPRTGCDA